MVDITGQEQEQKISEEKEKKHGIPLGTIRRIMRENGVDKISSDAVEEIGMMLNDVIRDISNNSLIYTRHAKRKITNKEDVLLALK